MVEKNIKINSTSARLLEVNMVKKPNRVFLIFILLVSSSIMLQAENTKDEINDLCDSYIEYWKQFYPSKALAAGEVRCAPLFENFSPNSIDRWLNVNKKILKAIPKKKISLSLDPRINITILKRQIEMELEKWAIDRKQHNAASLYTGLISQAMTYILVRDNLNPEEKIKAIKKRLAGINAFCLHAQKNLQNGSPISTHGSIMQLKRSALFYGTNLPDIAEKWLKSDQKSTFYEECKNTALQIKNLSNYIEEKILPNLSKTDYLGKKNYSRKLKLYTGCSLTPDELEKMSLQEIIDVRGLMADLSRKYWIHTYPNIEPPNEISLLLNKSLEDMEKDREDNQKDFLKLFIDLTNQAEAFVQKKNLVSVPKKRTLKIQMSPEHFSGAAVGGVYSAGPFDPDADTLLFLPTISDNAPQKTKEGFYRSFNNPFNRMIITHEIIPGHYHQLKIAAKNPFLVRSLFTNTIYAEGWATLCEELTLDHGWDNNNKLTRLAHLRKRLENAVRAYVSVKVHCHGWHKEQLTQFAVDRGLLAPQFAINLWNRVIASPMQITSYFLGYKKMSALLKSEKTRQGTRFNIREFNDKVLEAGSIPIDELPEILRNKIK
jgi:uncharacterized protein (DUF885 family)